MPNGFWIDKSPTEFKEKEIVTCGLMETKLEKAIGKIIDAELLQERQRAPYRFRNMTIREVTIRENPCTEKGCYEYSLGDCPGEVWVCLKYRSWKNVL
jgi:hypothetical protein